MYNMYVHGGQDYRSVLTTYVYTCKQRFEIHIFLNMSKIIYLILELIETALFDIQHVTQTLTCKLIDCLACFAQPFYKQSNKSPIFWHYEELK